MGLFKKRGELLIPPDVAGDPQATELARVWAAHGSQHVSLSPMAWEDPFAWGICLVDLARHLANAYEQELGRDRAQVLRRIKEGFDAEWATPTDEATGTVLE
jgi:hypothetical protein